MCPKVKLPASCQENWKPFEPCWNALVQEARHDVSFYKNFEFAMLINLVGKNPLGLNVMAYRIYSNKRRPRISVAYGVEKLIAPPSNKRSSSGAALIQVFPQDDTNTL